jgi:KDO2-lipid IV(A) lauroyltransferase
MNDRPLKNLFDKTVGALTVGLLSGIKYTDRRRMADFAGAFMRKVGPLFKEHRIGREQLRLAFPQKTDDEIEHILGGVWDNLGRIAISTSSAWRASANKQPMSLRIRRNPTSATSG